MSTSLAKELISSRFQPNAPKHQDMLNSFMRHGMTEEECVSEACLQILAGSETTATAIRSTMLFIMSNPQVYHKLQLEIDDAVKSGHASSPVITNAESKQLPYLQAVIKEGLRIHPPATDILSKTAPPEGDTVEIGGKKIFIPGGTNIGYAAWGVHRSKTVFGDDASVFRPERWLEAEKEQLAMMLRTHEYTFGYGKWSCLGKNVALMELDKVFFEVS
jgi:cytochrome P450